MSKYTTEVRFICETASGLTGSKGYNSVDEILDKALPKVFNFAFPIFDENYRTVLEKKILKHFYTREICEETVGLWKLRLDTRLNEIMPYYNQLYKSELLEFNPLYTVSLDTSGNKKGNEDRSRNRDNTESASVDDTVTTSGEHSESNKYTDYKQNNREESNAYSDTPQGSLSGVASNSYLTNYTKVGVTDNVTDDGQTDVNGNTSGKSVENRSESRKGNESENENVGSSEEYLEKVVGYSGTSASKSLLEYRETFLNIDMMVINELEDLFFQLW